MGVNFSINQSDGKSDLTKLGLSEDELKREEAISSIAADMK